MKILYLLGMLMCFLHPRRITSHIEEIPPVATDKIHPEQVKEIVTAQETKKIDDESFVSIPATSIKRRLLGPL